MVKLSLSLMKCDISIMVGLILEVQLVAKLVLLVLLFIFPFHKASPYSQFCMNDAFKAISEFGITVCSGQLKPF